MSITLFITSGTCDKNYNEINGEMGFHKGTNIYQMVADIRMDVDLEIKTLLMVDSRDMRREEDRVLILEQCRREKNERIVIIHGTDTIVKTAKLLGKNIKGKTVVLTGPMRPHALVKSDASFNFGAALAYVQLLPSGVYITMNGQYFIWDNVRKNTEKGIFERLK